MQGNGACLVRRATYPKCIINCSFSSCCSEDLQNDSRLVPLEDHCCPPSEPNLLATPAALGHLLRSANAVLDGRRIHDSIIRCGFEHDAKLGGLLVHFYAKCGAVDDATVLFATSPHQNVQTWNSMISAHICECQFEEAFTLFKRLQAERITPGQATFALILSACASHEALHEGRQVHDSVVKNMMETNIIVGTAVINMYGKCGSLSESRNTFVKIPCRDVIMWNAMIAVHVHHGQGREALNLFIQMQYEGETPNESTMVGALSACACDDVAITEGIYVHISMIYSGVESKSISENALISMYGKRGSLETARQTFSTIHERNVVSWNALISAHALHGQGSKALALCEQMRLEGVFSNELTFLGCLSACTTSRAYVEGARVHIHILWSGIEPDVTMGNTLMNMYSKWNQCALAWRVFDTMSQRNLVSWTTLIAAYAQNGQKKRALQLFHRMQLEGKVADKVSFVGILDACDSNPAEGARIHARIMGTEFQSDTVVATSILNMYGKCGNAKSAKEIFDNLVEKNEVCWTAMITSCAENGLEEEALLLYDHTKHEGFTPDTFALGSILEACASQTSLAQGMQIHASIVGTKYESDVIVGTALVNLYGKCGKLVNARRSFNMMLRRDLISWNALIAAYAQHGHDGEVFQQYINMQLDGFAPNYVTFISILSVCSHAGLISESHYFFTLMHQDYVIEPTSEHYGCIIDLLGRAGCLDKAERWINNMPSEPTVISFMSLLSACRYHSDIERGEHIAQRMLEKSHDHPALYIILLQIYSAGDGLDMLDMMKEMAFEDLSSCKAPKIFVDELVDAEQLLYGT